MPAFSNVMKRLGFVKLARYGLVLTPEDRIISLRPMALEDDLGARIVGWQDHDLAAMELATWKPTQPALPQAVATRVAPLAKPIAAPTPIIAVIQEPEEDDWEWTIALARARAAVADVEAASTPPTQARRVRADTVPPPRSRTMPMMTVVVPPARPPIPPTHGPRAQASSPVTVIPIPALPSIPSTIRLAPVVRPHAPPRRFPRGTASVAGDRAPSRAAGVTPPSPIRAADDDTTHDTTPGFTLPPAAAIPSVRRGSGTHSS